MEDAMAAAMGVVGGEGDEGEEEGQKISRKARKKLSRLSVAELKQLVERPDVVEVSVVWCGVREGASEWRQAEAKARLVVNSKINS